MPTAPVPATCHLPPALQPGHRCGQGLHLPSGAQAAGRPRALARHCGGSGRPPLPGAGAARQRQPGSAAAGGGVQGWAEGHMARGKHGWRCTANHGGAASLEGWAASRIQVRCCAPLLRHLLPPPQPPPCLCPPAPPCCSGRSASRSIARHLPRQAPWTGSAAGAAWLMMRPTSTTAAVRHSCWRCLFMVPSCSRMRCTRRWSIIRCVLCTNCSVVHLRPTPPTPPPFPPWLPPLPAMCSVACGHVRLCG